MLSLARTGTCCGTKVRVKQRHEPKKNDHLRELKVAEQSNFYKGNRGWSIKQSHHRVNRA
jgi:hypothetical protein